MIVHPMTGKPAGAPWPVRLGGVTGMVGHHGWTRVEGGKPKHHAGIDWLAPIGHFVYAAHDADVIRDGVEVKQGGYTSGLVGHGLRLYLFDGTLTTVYSHLAGQHVYAGDHVNAGQPIGWVGRTGNTRGLSLTDTHLHFEVLVEGKSINAEWWLHRVGNELGVGHPNRV